MQLRRYCATKKLELYVNQNLAVVAPQEYDREICLRDVLFHRGTTHGMAVAKIV